MVIQVTEHFLNMMFWDEKKIIWREEASQNKVMMGIEPCIRKLNTLYNAEPTNDQVN